MSVVLPATCRELAPLFVRIAWVIVYDNIGGCTGTSQAGHVEHARLQLCCASCGWYVNAAEISCHTLLVSLPVAVCCACYTRSCGALQGCMLSLDLLAYIRHHSWCVLLVHDAKSCHKGYVIKYTLSSPMYLLKLNLACRRSSSSPVPRGVWQLPCPAGEAAGQACCGLAICLMLIVLISGNADWLQVS